MSLAEELDAEQPPACQLCLYLLRQSPEKRDEWRIELLKPAGIRTHVAIARYLSKHGFEISEAAVRRHRATHR